MPVQKLLKTSAHVVAEFEGLCIAAGLNAVTGDEGSGKTRLLSLLSESHSDAFWLDLKLPGCNSQTPLDVWAHWRHQCPHWNEALCLDLCEALGMRVHVAKRLDMLSAGSRRKVGLLALLASGSMITCLDQPFAALDQELRRTLRQELHALLKQLSIPMILISHDQEDVNLFGEEVISIKNGKTI